MPCSMPEPARGLSDALGRLRGSLPALVLQRVAVGLLTLVVESAIIFAILCWLLHRRDLMLRENVSGERMPARA